MERAGELDASRHLQGCEVDPERPLMVGPVENERLKLNDRPEVVDDDGMELQPGRAATLGALSVHGGDAGLQVDVDASQVEDLADPPAGQVGEGKQRSAGYRRPAARSIASQASYRALNVASSMK